MAKNYAEKYPTWKKHTDTAYNKWRNWKDDTYETFLSKCERKERIAVLLDNLNYQVQNGGFNQWISNGYMTQQITQEIKIILYDMGTKQAQKVIEIIKDLEEYIYDEPEEEKYWEEIEKFDNPYYEINDEFEEEIEHYLKTR